MARVARVMATPTKRVMVVATRAAGDKEGDGVPLASLPPPPLPPLRLPAAASAHGGGGGGRFASTTTTRLGSTVEASSSASSAASPATLKTMNVVEHPSFEIVRTDNVSEYGDACIISCDRCDKFDIACDKCDHMRQNWETIFATRLWGRRMW